MLLQFIKIQIKNQIVKAILSYLLIFIFFSIIRYSKDRMKRSSSSNAQEISLKRLIRKQSNKSSNEDILKKYQAPSFGSECYQDQSWNKTFKDFYKTFAGNDFIEKARPSSKQALRKCLERPQTSKGVRNTEKLRKLRPQNKQTAFYSQHIGNLAQQTSQRPQRQNDINIQIIVTKTLSRKPQKNHARTKFETDLDDEFLQLFAN